MVSNIWRMRRESWRSSGDFIFGCESYHSCLARSAFHKRDCATQKPCRSPFAQLSSLTLLPDEVSHEAIRRNDVACDGDLVAHANDCCAGMVSALGALATREISTSQRVHYGETPRPKRGDARRLSRIERQAARCAHHS